MSPTPAGWYPESEGSTQLRYWDGEQWTEPVHPIAPTNRSVEDRVSPTPAGWYPESEGSTQPRYWDGEQWTERIHPIAPTPKGSVDSSVKERKRQEREARKADKRRRKEEARSQSKAAAAANAQAELQRYGREIVCQVFAFKNIRVYEHGFVKVSEITERSAKVQPRRLLSISASADVGKKSGAGRAVGAAMTGGLNLLGSNKRGDVYLTIVTEGQTYALTESPPTSGNMTTSKELEAIGNSVLRPSEQGQAGSTHERLLELKQLFDSGLISQGEFERKRSALLDGI